MITIAHSFTRVVVTTALLATALVAWPPAVAARGDDAHRGIDYVTILDARMEADSPRPALKIIRRALQASTARRER